MIRIVIAKRASSERWRVRLVEMFTLNKIMFLKKVRRVRKGESAKVASMIWKQCSERKRIPTKMCKE